MYLRMKEIHMEAQQLEKPPATRTPWNPSRVAIRRVKHPIQIPTTCRHCGGKVEPVHNSRIYGSAFGEWPWSYLCENCGAYVGMHPYTNLPLGTVANKSQREARSSVKRLFNDLWVNSPNRREARTKAYAWLASKMGLTEAECHFGLFDEDLCDRASDVIEEAHENFRALMLKGDPGTPEWAK